MKHNPLLFEQVQSDKNFLYSNLNDRIKIINTVNDNYKDKERVSLKELINLYRFVITYTEIYEKDEYINTTFDILKKHTDSLNEKEKTELNRFINKFLNPINNKIFDVDQFLYELIELKKINSYEDFVFNLTKMLEKLKEKNINKSSEKTIKDLCFFYINEYNHLILLNSNNEKKVIELVLQSQLKPEIVEGIRNLLTTSEANYIRKVYGNLISIDDNRTQFYNLSRIKDVIYDQNSNKEQELKSSKASSTFNPNFSLKK